MAQAATLTTQWIAAPGSDTIDLAPGQFAEIEISVTLTAADVPSLSLVVFENAEVGDGIVQQTATTVSAPDWVDGSTGGFLGDGYQIVVFEPQTVPDDCLTGEGTFEIGRQTIYLEYATPGALLTIIPNIVTVQLMDCGVPDLLSVDPLVPLHINVVPAAGACCHQETGVCEDSVAPENCAGVHDVWTQDTLCADLDPPCVPPTAFTYQGQLKLGGLPVDGDVDMQFMLYVSDAGGTPLA